MVRTCIQIDDEVLCWEVIPAWEHRFGIYLTSADFARATTVGQVWAVVEQRLIARFGEHPSGLTAAGATQRTFYQLRQALMARGMARTAVTPGLTLATVFPWWRRRRRWRQWQRESQLPLPALRTPAALFLAVWVGSTVAVWNVMPGWGVAVATGLCTALAADSLAFTRCALPAHTLGGLAKCLVGINYRPLTHPSLRNDCGEMRDIVLAGLARCGAEAEAIDPNELYDGTKLAR